MPLMSKLRKCNLIFFPSPTTKLHRPTNMPHSIVHPFWVRTPLIGRFYERPEWKSPLLEPSAVSSRILEQVLKGRSRRVLIPDTLGPMVRLRAMPVWYQIFVSHKITNLLGMMKASKEATEAEKGD